MTPKNRNKTEQGFIALITAIAISLILLVVTVALNQAGFLTRSTLLDSEYKERSSALAEACADTTFLKLVADPDPTHILSDAIIPVGTDTCTIHSVVLDGAPNQYAIETKAVFQEATTNLRIRIVVNASDISIVSWNELPSF